ncbi:MAG: NADH-quinone oxidoreductase subunit C [bacterium]|nr:NADH-quinone oxidoreductase subunit C [bacterium]
MTPDEVLAATAALLPAATPAAPELVRGDAVVLLPREGITEALTRLRDDPALRFEVLVDVTCVDYRGRTPRFEVVYQLRSLTHRHRLRVKVGVPEDDARIPSAFSVWRSASWGEREAYDLFGVEFTGHPDLRRLLLYPEFVGHPLRKDYKLDQRHPLVPERDPIVDPWASRGGER